ncbi:GNAT family N-acetyltransferase [Pelagibius sp. Alg239-R121]|uniref:GNAT family N-acetyltransferase n=1 Tax=Pelagibius sp. Alg239-R121 TaxID=2993448 RepID=UPI0024A777D4|nr:GNAT family N-acetyltransferase [Pelagibius sp. Alg239-R121]
MRLSESAIDLPVFRLSRVLGFRLTKFDPVESLQKQKWRLQSHWLYLCVMPNLLQNLQIAKATIVEKPAVARMLQLYLHDFSEFAKVGEPYGEIGNDGTFQYEHFDSYWNEAEREALLLRVNGHIAGFVLVNQWSASSLGTDNSMAEFFVLRKYRRSGIGKLVASKIIRQRSGKWEIPVADYNQPALAFWRSVVSSLEHYSHEEIPGDGRR